MTDILNKNPGHTDFAKSYHERCKQVRAETKIYRQAAQQQYARKLAAIQILQRWGRHLIYLKLWRRTISRSLDQIRSAAKKIQRAWRWKTMGRRMKRYILLRRAVARKIQRWFRSSPV